MSNQHFGPDQSDTNESPNVAGSAAPRPPADASGPGTPPPPPPGYGPMMPMGMPPAGRSGGVVSKVMTSLISFVLLFSLGLNLYLGVWFAASMNSGIKRSTFQEGDGKTVVAVVPIEGTIDGSTVEKVRVLVDNLRSELPDAVLLRINSGGGGVTASDQIWAILDSFGKENPGVPIVASFGGMAASGGYYIATPAQHIVAENTTVTGSIGVMLPAFTIEGLLEMIGVTDETMVASQSPKKEDGNTIFRGWTDEDRAALQPIIDQAYERFLEVVVKGRTGKLTPDQVRQLADGSIYTAQQAFKAGLVDEIGYFTDAATAAAQLAGAPIGEVPKIVILSQPRPLNLATLLGSRQSIDAAMAPPSPEQVRQYLSELGEPRLSYHIHLP